MRKEIGLLLVVVESNTAYVFCNFCSRYYETSSFVTCTPVQWRIWTIFEDQFPDEFEVRCFSHGCKEVVKPGIFQLFNHPMEFVRVSPEMLT
jgi:hypothetical protein